MPACLLCLSMVYVLDVGGWRFDELEKVMIEANEINVLLVPPAEVHTSILPE